MIEFPHSMLSDSYAMTDLRIGSEIERDELFSTKVLLGMISLHPIQS